MDRIERSASILIVGSLVEEFSHVGPFGGTPAPPAPPSSGMTLWLNGRVGIVETDGNVSEWEDQSGGGNNYTGSGASQPTLGTINSKTALEFTAANASNLVSTTGADILSAGAFTIFLVWQYTGNRVFSLPNASFTNPTIFYVGTAYLFSNAIDAGQDGSTAADVDVATTSKVSPATPSSVQAQGLIANPHQSYHAFDGASTYVSIDEGTVASVGSSGTLTDLSTSQIGGGPTSTDQRWQGTVGEIIVYDRTLTAPEIAQTQAFLKYQWSL
jgi:hypothetical protein